MDGSGLTESLDSLWFFSNVLFSSQPLDPSRNHVQEPVTEKISDPISGNLKNRPNQSPLSAEKPVRVEPETVESAESPSPGSTEREDKRRRSRRNKKCRRKILGEIDGKEISESNAWVYEGKLWCIYLKCGDLYDHYKHMPPFHDNVAMKEHLKSWAYAVACSVK